MKRSILLLNIIVSIRMICLAEVKVIQINVATTYQTMDHFGASDCWSMQKIDEWDLENKERVADLLFSKTEGIGLSGWRFNIGAGINRVTISHPWRTVETFEVNQDEYDWSRQENERWFLQAAKERNQLIAVLLNMDETPQEVSFQLSGYEPNQSVGSFTPYLTSNKTGDDIKQYDSFSYLFRAELMHCDFNCRDR